MRRKHKKNLGAKLKIETPSVDLPKDIWNEIANVLFGSEKGRNRIIALSQVNHEFYKICSDDRFWKYSADEEHIKLYGSDGITGINYTQPREKQFIYNHPKSLLSIIGPSKRSLLELRNNQICAQIQLNRKEYFASRIPSLMLRSFDVFEFISLLIGHFFWVLNIFVQINTFVIFLPLFFVSIMWCFNTTAALVTEWAVPPNNFGEYGRGFRYSYLYALSCRTLNGHKIFNAPKLSGF